MVKVWVPLEVRENEYGAILIFACNAELNLYAGKRFY